jgi:hypothetical protein
MPVTILVDEPADGARLHYDSTASLIAAHGNPSALADARGFDARIEDLLRTAAQAYA